MLGGSAFLWYLGWMPANDANGLQTALAFWGLFIWMVVVAISGGIAIRIGLSFPPLTFGGWGIVSSYERFDEIRQSPDLNGDGLFSISDVPSAIASIFLEPGRRLSDEMAISEIGPFLEITTDPYSVFWSIVFSILVYFMMITALSVIWTYEDESDDG